jgi:hypothetical protein
MESSQVAWATNIWPQGVLENSHVKAIILEHINILPILWNKTQQW